MPYDKFSHSILLIVAVLLVRLPSAVGETPHLPLAIGADPGLEQIEEVRSWGPEDMFEHVNGEAELLKRYGVVNLSFISYENDQGDYFSVDIIDLFKPINAYGLYRLYTGCDGFEYRFSEALINADEFAAHAAVGPYYLRFNIDVSESAGSPKDLINDFLKTFSSNRAKQPVLPAALASLQEKARKSCEVHYHPEHIDYDLESGPGYSWVGPDNHTYFAALLTSRNEAELYASTLQARGIKSLLVSGNSVIWRQGGGSGQIDYLTEIAQAMARN